MFNVLKEKELQLRIMEFVNLSFESEKKNKDSIRQKQGNFASRPTLQKMLKVLREKENNSQKLRST